MHLDRPGKADRLAHQALQPGAQRQRLPLARLRVTLARQGRICIEVTGVSAPIVRIIPFDSKRFQPGFELSKPFILATSKPVGQYLSTAGLKRGPEPPRLSLFADQCPHLVHFGLFRHTDDDGHLIRIHQGKEAVVHIAERGRFFFSVLMTVVELIFNTRAVSRMPRPLRAMSTICSWIAGQRPL